MKNLSYTATTLAIVVAIGLIGWLAFRVFHDDATPARNSYAYDISEFKRTDPAMLLCRETGEIKTGVAGVHALAVDSKDNIYAGGSTSVAVFARDGSVVGGFAVTQAVECLAISAGGDIYAGMEDHIEIYDPAGSRKASWESPRPSAILTSISTAGNELFAADFGHRIVWRYDLSGKLLGRIGERDNDKRRAGFVIPSPYFDVVALADGTVWTANTGTHRLEHFSAEGALLSSWGEPSMRPEGFCGCCNPSHFAMLPDGSFVTSEKGLPRVKLYDREGKFLGVVAGTEQFLDGTVGLDTAVDSTGRILVLDPKRGTVRIFERNK